MSVQTIGAKPAGEGGMQGVRRSIRRHLIVGLSLVGVLAGGLGTWASTQEISGALIAPGQIVVESNVKKVQHPTGGDIGEQLARDGDGGKAGQNLDRLDDTPAEIVTELGETLRQTRMGVALTGDLTSFRGPARSMGKSTA